MNKRVIYFYRLFFLTFSIIFSTILIGQQPSPCVNPVMTPLCEDACVICDINGFSGINNSTEQGVAPPDFCTTEWHNITWIAFIAGSENLTLQVSVSNCQTGLGLEIGIYESLDCQTMNQVTFCNTDVPSGTTATFSNNSPLTIGQHYYFVMDGSDGDICNYQVTVTNGTTEIGALDPITEMSGPTSACVGETQTYEVDELIGANIKVWTIDGMQVLEDSNVLEQTWNTAGTYNLCFSAANVCDTPPPICTQVVVTPLPDIIYNEEICGDECFYIPELDTSICAPGLYNFSNITDIGCTQNITLDLSVIPPVYTDLEITFCYGDSIIIDGQAFSETGMYDIPISTSFTCDSIVQLDLTTFLCDIEGGFADDNLDCNGDNNGQLSFNLVDGVFPYSYNWEEINDPILNGSGTSSNSNGLIQIPNLVSGIYSITVTDAAGSFGIFLGQVFEPNPIIVQSNYSDYNGFGTSCFDAIDGEITLNLQGGSAPFIYNWENGDTAANVDSLIGGIYLTTITDSKGCSIIHTSVLTNPDEISATINLTEPGCNPDNSGVISVSGLGGAEPYQYSIDDETFGLDSIFNELNPGDYFIQIRDANGCETSIDVSLADPNILYLDLGEEQLVELGETIQLEPITNINNLEYEWLDTIGLSCTDCAEPFLTPLETSYYTLVATMPNGCYQTDSILIRLDKQRDLFVPNIFSPNGDGFNDLLQIYAGKEVQQILEFKVFARWGELVYDQQQFLPNDFNFGWDGTFKGKKMNSNVFVWMAKVEFIDGVEEVFSGDVLLAY